MIGYLIVRLVRWIVGLSIILFVTYAMMYYGVGDPIRRMFMSSGESSAWADERMIEELREKYHLDEPFPQQFKRYMTNLLHGDLGVSIADYSRPVWHMVKAKLPISMQLGLAATALMSVVGIPLGVVAALYHNRWVDSGIIGSIALVNAIPQFVSGPLLMLFLVLVLGIMEVPYGWKGIFHQQVILPVVVLAFGGIQTVIRQTRAGMLEVIQSDYIRTARAKGLPERMVILRHMLRPVMTPVVTSIGLIMITMVNGAIYIETVFNIPGFGQLTVAGLHHADYAVIMATVLIGTLIVLASNLLVDLVYPLLDPRITHQ